MFLESHRSSDMARHRRGGGQGRRNGDDHNQPGKFMQLTYTMV